MKSEVGFNTDDNPRWIKENVEIYRTELLIYLKDILPLGYRTLFIRKKENPDKVCKDKTEKNEIENEILNVKIQENGSVIIKNKKENIEKKGFLIFENSGDDGDTYDYSEPYNDRILTSENSEIKILKSEKNSLLNEIKYIVKMSIPYDLKAREKGENDIETEFIVTLSLEKGSPLLKVDVETENKSIEHRVRILFKTGIESIESIADQQFGTIRRPVCLSEVENWRENGWNEKPRTIEPMQSFVSLANKYENVSIITDCVREYQITGRKYDTIALTLFRSVPKMGKSELKDRPGRASGMADWETPDAQLLKKLKFNFAVFIGKGEYSASKIANIAKEYLTPLQCYQAAEFKNVDIFFLMNKPEIQNTPFDYSMLSFESRNCILSTVKKAEKENSLIVRIYNPDYKNPVDFNMTYNGNTAGMSIVKFDEETIMENIDFNFAENMENKKSRIKISGVKTCQVLSIKI
jgi:alpha-mannosidase mngB